MGQSASPPPRQWPQPLRSHVPALQWSCRGCGSAPQPTYRYGAQAAEELAREWARAEESLVLRAAMLHAKRASLLRAAASAAPAATAAASLASPHKGPAYVPLLERPTAASVEMVHAQAAERAGRKKRAAAGDSEAAAATCDA